MKSDVPIKKQNILFLQGPMGLFFRKMDNLYRAHGAKTYRICLNGGDYFFSNKSNITNYNGKQSGWSDFIESFYRKKSIGIILLFGECRFYHKIAIQIAKEISIKVYVFEEGYIRPNYITVEKYGVNAFSGLPSASSFYYNLKNLKKPPKNENFKKSYYFMSIQGITY